MEKAEGVKTEGQEREFEGQGHGGCGRKEYKRQKQRGEGKVRERIDREGSENMQGFKSDNEMKLGGEKREGQGVSG